MKKLKVTKHFFDTETRESLKPKQTIERADRRAQKIIAAGVAQEVKPPKVKSKKD